MNLQDSSSSLHWEGQPNELKRNIRNQAVQMEEILKQEHRSMKDHLKELEKQLLQETKTMMAMKNQENLVMIKQEMTALREEIKNVQEKMRPLVENNKGSSLLW